jgi:hypothetical protein
MTPEERIQQTIGALFTGQAQMQYQLEQRDAAIAERDATIVLLTAELKQYREQFGPLTSEGNVPAGVREKIVGNGGIGSGGIPQVPRSTE